MNKILDISVKAHNKKYLFKEKIKERLLDESGEGFKDANTIYWVIGILLGVAIFIPILILASKNILNTQSIKYENMADGIG